MSQSKVIVTLAIGKHYRERWHKLCSANWRRYAQLHGYDLICIESPLDDSPRARARSAAWQKCLVLSDERVQKYDRVVWIDSDILINPKSPCIVSSVSEDKVGAVDTFAPFERPLPGTNYLLMNRAIEFLGWSFHNAKEYYLKAGFHDPFEQVVQTGVMVVSPRYHRSILEYTYYNYDDTAIGDFEMEALSYELLKANCVHWLNETFNQLWIVCMLREYPFLLPIEQTEMRLIRVWKRFARGHYKLPPRKITEVCLTTSFINNYFLHFAGVSQYMPWVDTDISNWMDLLKKI
jgi:hypothetical protein